MTEPGEQRSDQPAGWAPKRRPFRRLSERLIVASLGLSGLLSVFVTFSIVIVLFQQTAGFFGLHGEDSPGAVNITEIQHAKGLRPRQVERPGVFELSEVRSMTLGDADAAYIEFDGPVDQPMRGLSLVLIGSPALGTAAAPADSGRVLAGIGLDELSVGGRRLPLIGADRSFLGARAQLVDGTIRQDSEAALTYVLLRGPPPSKGADLDADDDGTLDAPLPGEVVDALVLEAKASPAEQGHAYPEVLPADRSGAVITGNVQPRHAYRDVLTGEWDLGNETPTYITVGDFITGLEWNPLLGTTKHFGIWPLIGGTLLVTAVAMLVAVPGGLLTAIFLSEYAPRRLRAVLKPVLEVLAGIPTVVYGFFALTVITPALRDVCEWLLDKPVFGIYNAFSAGVAVGIMCLPIVCSMSEDALQAVPRQLREGAYGLGSTRFDVSVKVVFPAALSGIVAAVLLAVARSVGETMIVALAAGGRPLEIIKHGELNLAAFSPTNETQTMTAYMVQIFLGDASNFGPEYLSSYAVAAALFVLTLVLTIIGGRILKRFREEYQ